MANKNASTAHLAPYQFKPGNCANPGGRPKELFTRKDAQLMFQEYLNLDPHTLIEITKGFMPDGKPSVAINIMVANAVLRAAAKGDLGDVAATLDQAVGAMPKPVAPTDDSTSSHAEVLAGMPKQKLIEIVKEGKKQK